MTTLSYGKVGGQIIKDNLPNYIRDTPLGKLPYPQPFNKTLGNLGNEGSSRRGESNEGDVLSIR